MAGFLWQNCGGRFWWQIVREDSGGYRYSGGCILVVDCELDSGGCILLAAILENRLAEKTNLMILDERNHKARAIDTGL